MRPFVSVNRRMRRLAPGRREAALLVALAAGALVYGCQKSAAVNAQVEGQITRIFVKSGDHVEAGTLLLQIDPLKQEATVSSQEASRAAQEANLRYAKISLERAQK